MTSSEICVNMVKCLENVWSDQMLFDFVVKIADETIECHRLILAACSEFFKGLFRSGMREVTENCVVLEDISSDVFKIILKIVYTGSNLLTLENNFEVWRAVHQLQIPFLVNLCETFAIEALTVDTWGNIYTNAKLLDSKRVLKGLQTFMLKNFEQVSLSTTFLQMSFSEVRDLIQSQDLVVASEDIVLESVIRWVGFIPHSELNRNNVLETHSKPNMNGNDPITETTLVDKNHGDITKSIEENNTNAIIEANSIIETNPELKDYRSDKSRDILPDYSSRKDKLTELLQHVRTCLVSPSVLSHVYKMKIISESNVLMNIIFDAIYYVQNFRHGQWPTAAIQRSCSKYFEAGVLEQNDGEFTVLNVLEYKLYDIPKCKFLQENVQLVSFDGELFATGRQLNQPNGPCKLFVFCDKYWLEVLSMPGPNLLLLSHDQFIYIFNKDNQIIYRIQPKQKLPILETFTLLPKNAEIKHSMNFEKFILIFCSETDNGIDKTAVHKLDISSKIWTKLAILDGAAEHIISFKNDNYCYVLQADGCLWTILNSNSNSIIELKFVLKLWNIQKILYGALAYRDLLIIGFDCPSPSTIHVDRVKIVPGHFQEIKYWTCKDKCSNLIPITLPKKYIS
ncbi:uncharacterized protein LOC131947754 [Physella acuta]|uniref:uncharacterized protein LOC131947754 n=1 Tax=Physella acuta TaxID=109671 RepID=UPI0027DE3000|nr:uncharacterized protein LOC131947754 [Physella acuta]